MNEPGGVIWGDATVTEPGAVSGSGYAPDSSVTISLVSPGLDDDQATLATISADATGTIDSTAGVSTTIP